MPLLVDKPQGWTSHDIVAKVRKEFGIKKVGHAGTLDPMATGLLIVLIGRAETKLQDMYMAERKTYIAEITLGQTSTTDDSEGQLTEAVELGGISEKIVLATLEQFEGVIQQQVPAYSAVHQNGQRLYKLARKGEIDTATLPVREVEIFSLRLQRFELPTVIVQVECSKGTYIRSLARDIGARLGVGGYLSGLRRTAIGKTQVEQAITPDQFPLAAAEYHRQHETNSAN